MGSHTPNYFYHVSIQGLIPLAILDAHMTIFFVKPREKNTLRWTYLDVTKVYFSMLNTYYW
jgi:hypothetical protein